MAARATRSARRAAASSCHLLTIFPELQLHVAGFLSDPSDCAALCLAAPRLGLRALRELPQYKEILVSVALRLATGELRIDEAVLRRYLSDERMTDEGCAWLTAAAQGSPHRIVSTPIKPEDQFAHWLVRTRTSPWQFNGALVRTVLLSTGAVWLHEGKDGAERVVLVKWPDGRVHHYEGERGEERVVRGDGSDGSVHHYEGERGEERVVRAEDSDGSVHHFEGESDAERMVCMELTDGTVIHYEGEKGAERVVRVEWPDGKAHHFEGERGAERMARAEDSGGSVHHFEGERDAERMVCMELTDGTVIHYEGEKGAERQVREEWPDGSVVHFDADGNATHPATHDALK